MFGRRKAEDVAEIQRLAQVKDEIAREQSRAEANRLQTQHTLATALRAWADLTYRTLELSGAKKIKDPGGLRGWVSAHDKIFRIGDTKFGVGREGLWRIQWQNKHNTPVEELPDYMREEFMQVVKQTLLRLKVDTSGLPPAPFNMPSAVHYVPTQNAVDVRVIGSDGFPADWAR
jgi:hypothetical protein